MKNNQPIILNCFSRGGSNILWNILLSHPDVCSPIEETLQIFRFDWRERRKSGLQVAWLTRQLSFFDQWNLTTRKPISQDAQKYIDETLFSWKLKTLNDSEMRSKSSDTFYSRHEVEQARLVIKNNNGLIFLSEQFLKMYKNPIFFALVRDPLPLYESHKRNKTPVSASPQKFADFYFKMIDQMQKDAKQWDCYHILRFEDILGKPVESIQKIYSLANLDISKVSHMRFKAKPYMQADGRHATPYEAGKHYWFSFSQISKMLVSEVNENQISKLTPKELEEISFLTRDVRIQSGYMK
jgi:hypothetical protein